MGTEWDRILISNNIMGSVQEDLYRHLLMFSILNVIFKGCIPMIHGMYVMGFHVIQWKSSGITLAHQQQCGVE